AGVGRANLAGIAAAIFATAAGVAVSLQLPLGRKLEAGGTAFVAALTALAVFAAISLVLNRNDLRALARQARSRI
ncbi:MAG: hypothetical protein ACRDN0_31785, partial [Trebonia sp.]